MLFYFSTLTDFTALCLVHSLYSTLQLETVAFSKCYSSRSKYCIFCEHTRGENLEQQEGICSKQTTVSVFHIVKMWLIYIFLVGFLATMEVYGTEEKVIWDFHYTCNTFYKGWYITRWSFLWFAGKKKNTEHCQSYLLKPLFTRLDVKTG